MKLPIESKFRRWVFVEVARWWAQPTDGKPPRLVRYQKGPKNKRVPVLLEWPDDVERYRQENGNLGIYTSLFHYDSVDLGEATRLGSLYFDLDSPGAERAADDAQRLVRYLLEFAPRESIRLYFTGDKGFHVECEAISFGIGPSNNLPGHFRYIATQLVDLLGISTFDFAVYDLRRMWRLPNSQHQGTGLFKVEIDPEQLVDLDGIRQYASTPHFEREVPAQKFHAACNEWYREWAYQREEQKQISIEDRIARFEQHGTNLIYREDTNSELVFDPVKLFTNCPAIIRLWDKAEREHDLSHEERLFLCSLLTYTEEAEYYLHAILYLCDDYDPAKSQAHISDWKRRREMGTGGRPYTCQRANAVGVGCGDCNLPPMEKLERIGDQLIRTGDEAHPSPIRFAYFRRKKV